MSESSSHQPPGEPSRRDDAEKFPVVGIGASAGGLEAVTDIFRNLPPSPGMAIVLVQHLDPHHESLLTEILARETSLNVAQARDGDKVEKNFVYVIPPNYGLSIDNGRLHLTPREEVPGPFLPIDQFFRSLSLDQGHLAIAVVLSGGGTDGALGLAEVKATDGITFAQDEATARQDSMPRHAISTGSVDFVLTPAGIAHELARLSREFYAHDEGILGGDALLAGEAGGIQRILKLVSAAKSVDFSQYKGRTIRRRIRRRMGLAHFDSIDEYLALLQDRPDEVEALYQDFLIRVTSFFRDAKAFQALQEQVIPNILQRRESGDPIRLWVPGCATGEEVYSVAIAFLESLGDQANNTPIKILATDVNDLVLEKARAGIYLDNISMDVSAERLRRFFVQVNGNFQISKSIRELCIFSKHNVVTDTPFANLDLISCRNLLIYLDRPLQQRILPYFHYALRPDGYLMLGPSESIGGFNELFAIKDHEHKIFAKKATLMRMLVDLPRGGASVSKRISSDLEPPELFPASDIQREADRILLTRYVPPGVVVDEDSTILQFRGKTGPYLNPVTGAASLDLLKMVRPGLVPEVREALERAKADNVRVKRDHLDVTEEGQARRITVEVIPLRPQDSIRYFLVLFDDVVPGEGEQRVSQPSTPGTGTEPVDQARLKQLERELSATRDYLQTTIEDNEAANEELKAANEEILSSNEELQSTNEELQTAKEEMQSANEELGTVNEELNHRNRELRELSDDLVNLLEGLDIPVVMVNRQLRIRRYTPRAESLFNVISTDIGRPISDLRPKLQTPDLGPLIADVIDTLTVKEFDVQDETGRWYSLRIRPYVTADKKIDGAAIAAVSIDIVKRAAEQMRESRDFAEAIVETVREPLLVLDEHLRVKQANAAFYRTFNLRREDVENQVLGEIGQQQWNHAELQSHLQELFVTWNRVRNIELDLNFPDLGQRSVLINAQRIFWQADEKPQVLLAIQDITERKRESEQEKLLIREQAARAEAEASNQKKDEFLAMLAHELRNPLAPIRNTLYLLTKRFANDPIANHAVQLSERQIGHMARLLDDLLDVSRITRGKIQLRRELIDLRDPISRAVETTRHLIDDREQTLNISVPEEPIYLEADPARLEQILCNLLNNAAKYSDPAGRITLKAERENNYAEVSVSDTGMGISQEVLPHVFDLFSQADRTLDRAAGGLGIGLTLVKTLVELHGGSIEALSAGTGEGATFVVRLPVVGGHIATSDQSEQPPVFAPSGPVRRILVVDDNVAVADTMAMALRLDGHQVETAHSGPEALRCTAAIQPDVLLLDIGLPGMNGYEVAQKVRSDQSLSNVLIIALSGYGREEDLRHARECGIDHHLIKPVDFKKLECLLKESRHPSQ